jgi:hypothetical protein
MNRHFGAFSKSSCIMSLLKDIFGSSSSSSSRSHSSSSRSSGSSSRSSSSNRSSRSGDTPLSESRGRSGWSGTPDSYAYGTRRVADRQPTPANVERRRESSTASPSPARSAVHYGQSYVVGHTPAGFPPSRLARPSMQRAPSEWHSASDSGYASGQKQTHTAPLRPPQYAHPKPNHSRRVSITDNSPVRHEHPPLAWEQARSSSGNTFWHDGEGNTLHKKVDGRRKSFVVVDTQGREVRNPVEIVGARHRDGGRMKERQFVEEYNKRENSTSATVRHNLQQGAQGHYKMETDIARYDGHRRPVRVAVDPSHTRTYFPDRYYR